jgi:hypothetical protein
LFLFVLTGVSLFSTAPPVHALFFVSCTDVTNANDNGTGSLRAVLACATNGATIHFLLPTPTKHHADQR